MANRVDNTEDPTPTELDKFRALVFSVHTLERPVRVRCQSLEEAKALRRRFYRLRDSLAGSERDIANAVVFSIVNHVVHCTKASGITWVDNVEIGASENETESSGGFSGGT